MSEYPANESLTRGGMVEVDDNKTASDEIEVAK